MQTLDVSSEPKPTNRLLKRLFWPTVENGSDVDLIGRQGFWVCFVVATAWTIGSFFMPHTLLGLLIGATYFLGALGIREQSISAAVLAFFCLFLDRIASLEAYLLDVPGGGNPRIGILATVLLLLNIRATILSRRWRARETPTWSEQPDYSVNSSLDRLVNQLPSVLWPRARYVFYPLAAILMLISVTAFFGLPQMSERQREMKSTRTEMAEIVSR